MNRNFDFSRKFDYKISFLHRKQIVRRQKEVAESFLFLQNFEFPEDNFFFVAIIITFKVFYLRKISI